MRFITACDRSFRPYALNLARTVHDQEGVKLWIYDLSVEGDLEPGETHAVCRLADRDDVYQVTSREMHDSEWPRAPWKPKVIGAALAQLDGGVVWLDADCLMTAPVSGDLVDCDMAITVRTEDSDFDPTNVGWGLFNSGCLYFGRKAESLVQFWDGYTNMTMSDQESLAHILLHQVPWRALDRTMRTYLTVGDPTSSVGGNRSLRLQILPSITHNDYNYRWHAQEHPAKVLHFKGVDGRNPERAAEYLTWVDRLIPATAT